MLYDSYFTHTGLEGWQLGSVVSRPLGDRQLPLRPYKHYGVIIGYDYLGYPVIRSFYGDGVIKDETFQDFGKGFAVKNEGYWGNLAPHEVIHRVARVNEARYCLVSSNCEHFVRYAHGLEVDSFQVNRTILAFGAIVALWALSGGKTTAAV